MSGCCSLFTWCEATLPGHTEHDSSTYIRATRTPDRTVTVGAGVIVDDAPGRPLSVFIHINDEHSGVDEDAHMTTDEAVVFVAALNLAISHAREAA